MGHGYAGRGGHALATCQHGRLKVGMTAGVLDQVVASHEALVAQGAQEAFFSCVGASVAGELIGAGELLLAVRPGTGEGPLTCSTETEGTHFTSSVHTCIWIKINDNQYLIYLIFRIMFSTAGDSQLLVQLQFANHSLKFNNVRKR